MANPEGFFSPLGFYIILSAEGPGVSQAMQNLSNGNCSDTQHAAG